MRLFALLSIIISEILILALVVLKIESSNLSLISSLVVAMISAFAFSALLRNIKSLKASKNYIISGILGIVLATIYYLWAIENLAIMVEWLKTTGIYFLLLLILIASLILFKLRSNGNIKL